MHLEGVDILRQQSSGEKKHSYEGKNHRRQRNPPRPPFAKGGDQRVFFMDRWSLRSNFSFPPLKKGGEGGFSVVWDSSLPVRTSEVRVAA